MTLESNVRAEGSAGAAHEFGRIHPSIALAPFVEALVVGRRVAVLGDVSLGLADALVARGARLVHAYDPDAARVAEAIARKAPTFGSAAAGRPAARGVVHAVLGDDLGVRDGAFDVVLMPDLSLFADRDDVVRRARKLAAPTGAVVVSSPNPDAKRRLIQGEESRRAAPTYYEIYDLLSLQFPVVRMVGQAPFVGYAIVDFAPDREPDVSFDASLMSGTEEPEAFVAIASERPISTDPYLVVEVPSADVLEASAHARELAANSEPSSQHDVRQPFARDGRFSAKDQVQLAELQARLVLMEAELDDLRAQKGDLARQLDGAREAAEHAELRARQASAEGAARLRESERSSEAEAERWRELEARAGDEHVRAERLGHKVRDLDEELVRQRDRAQKLTKLLDDEKRARQKAEIELGMARGLARPEGEPDLEARVQELTDELHRARAHADSLASELLAKSKETAELRREHEAAEEKVTELRRELGAVESKNADLARDLHAAHLRIDEIEEQAQTLRRPPPLREPVVVSGEVQGGMVARITRLEAAAHAERQNVEDARREAEISKHAAEDLKREAEVAKREADAAKHAADELRRAAEAAKHAADEARRQVAVATVQRDAASMRAEKLTAELEEERTARKDLVLAKATLEAEVVGLKKRLEDAMAEREAEAGPEVSALEAALRERGYHIARLERDLRESERIGKELIAEIEALRVQGGGNDEGGAPPNGQAGGSRTGGAHTHGSRGMNAAPAQASAGGVDPVTAGAFQHRIDALAADAAQKQAELLTATLKIQALEREVAGARASTNDPGLAQRELATALVRAQSEIAELRRAATLRGEDSGAPRAVIENAVLLQQAAR